MERGAARLLSPNGDPLREALYSNQKAVALETGAVTTAITPREQRWPRSISIFRCLEELQMTVTMEDSQSVVMKKHMPELERLQLRKEKREKEAGEEGEDKIQVKQVMPNPRTAQLKGYGFISLSHSTLFSFCTPTTCQRYARCREYKAEYNQPFCRERHTKRSALLEAKAPCNRVGKPINSGVKRSAGDF